MSRYATAHQDPQGPGDARPTALQIVQDEGFVGKLTGKTVLVTGANQGIGLETARAFYATGATIFLGVRSLEKGKQAIEDITASEGLRSQGTLHLVEMSLDSLDSVRKGARDFLAKSESRLNILILNAGIMAGSKTKTMDGFESAFGINHVGHFLLFQLLKDALLASATSDFNSRVIAVSSMAHRASEIRFHDFNFDEEGSFETFASYGQSKTANIYMANEIERRYGSRGLHAISLHPGAIHTNLTQSATFDVEAIKAQLGEEAFNKMLSGLKSQPQGAATTIYAALSKDWEGKGGKYLTDCTEAGPAPAGYTPGSMDPGYAPWAYDEDKAARLWEESSKMIGVVDDA
ncbi:WW domain-containing oxidoreductase [Colletotrichum liriopes]|uniref:WW domain-containing oxidoreductase n=1 Tax=Colletotrichum liriopes TaxID=708192 RepID=A0AA37LQY0_9PEZI|nr:WW domain-containing oxidoreductase [Colletotrichum liriopes]